MKVAEREQTLEQLLKKHDIQLERQRSTGVIKVNLEWSHYHEKNRPWFTDGLMTDGEYVRNEDLNKMRSGGRLVRAVFGGEYVVVLRHSKEGRCIMRVIVREGTNEHLLIPLLENIFAHGYAR